MGGYGIKSIPIELHWAGWRTDTFLLQQAGWQLSAEQDVRSRTMRIAVNHPELQMQGITNMMTHEYRRLMYENHMHGIGLQLGMGITHMGRTVMINNYQSESYQFVPIDAEPKIIMREIRSLDDLAHFQTIQKPKNEVFLKEASMEEILEMALQKQEPEQERIRKRILREQEMRQCGEFHTALNII